jgi:hypothetical protein
VPSGHWRRRVGTPLVFDGPPQALDEDVVSPGAFHRDMVQVTDNSLVPGKLATEELRFYLPPRSPEEFSHF